MIDTVISLAILVVLWISASGVGRLIYGIFRLSSPDYFVDKLLCQATIGFFAIAALIGAVNWLGMAHDWFLAAITVATAIVGVVDTGWEVFKQQALPRSTLPEKPARQILAQGTPNPSASPKSVVEKKWGPFLGFVPSTGAFPAAKKRRRHFPSPPGGRRVAREPTRPSSIPLWVRAAAFLTGSLAGGIGFICALVPSSAGLSFFPLTTIQLSENESALVVHSSSYQTQMIPGLAGSLELWAHALGGIQAVTLLGWSMIVAFAYFCGGFAAAIAGKPWRVVATAVILTSPAIIWAGSMQPAKWFLPLLVSATALSAQKMLELPAPGWVGASALLGGATCLLHPAGALAAGLFTCSLLAARGRSLRAIVPPPILYFAVVIAAFATITGASTLLRLGHLPPLVQSARPLNRILACEEKSPNCQGNSFLADPAGRTLHLSTSTRCPDCNSNLPTSGPKQYLRPFGFMVPVMLPAIFWYGIPRSSLWIVAASVVYAAFVVHIGADDAVLLPLAPLAVAAVLFIWQSRSQSQPWINGAVDALGVALLCAPVCWFVPELGNRLTVLGGHESIQEYWRRHDPTWPIQEVLSLWPRDKQTLLVLVFHPKSALSSEGTRPTCATNEGQSQANRESVVRLLIQRYKISHVLLAHPEGIIDRPVAEESCHPLFDLSRSEETLGAMRILDHRARYSCAHMWHYQLFFIDPASRQRNTSSS